MNGNGVKMADLRLANMPFEEEIVAAVRRVVASGRFLMGEETARLETELSLRLGGKNVVVFSSGTSALVAALRALEAGPGDEVILPAFTIPIDAEAIFSAGATPVCVDIEDGGFGIDFLAAGEARTARTKAVISVDIFGAPCDYDRWEAGGPALLCDACQAIGASFCGRPAGTLGDIGCLSFYPTKNLGGVGNGGACVTSDPAIARVLRRIRNHGWEEKYVPLAAGFNGHIDEIQAAVLCVKLPHLDRENGRRGRIAQIYTEGLAACGDVVLPKPGPGRQSNWHQYTVLTRRRDDLGRHLAAAGIGSEVHFPLPLHKIPFLVDSGIRAAGGLSRSERASREALSLPLNAGLTDAECRRVVEAVLEFPW